MLQSFLLAQVALSNPVEDAFKHFVNEYRKSYTTEEYNYRKSVFAENLAKINKQNEEHWLTAGSAVFGVTMFSDMTQEEFAKIYLTAKVEEPTERVNVTVDAILAAVDWRTKNMVTDVKDQGKCGSCWAFSATAAIESFAAIAGKGLNILAPQQIVSCDNESHGCHGGATAHAFAYVHNAGGLEKETSYPYTSGNTSETGTCKFKPTLAVVKVNGFVHVAKGESNLEAALNKGPVSASADASQWNLYKGGILSVCDKNVNHAVQVVGYTADYWIVRSSWSPRWGEQGYIRIKRGSDLCALADYVNYPTI